jgi:hypothetical protein
MQARKIGDDFTRTKIYNTWYYKEMGKECKIYKSKVIAEDIGDVYLISTVPNSIDNDDGSGACYYRGVSKDFKHLSPHKDSIEEAIHGIKLDCKYPGWFETLILGPRVKHQTPLNEDYKYYWIQDVTGQRWLITTDDEGR